MRKHGGKMDMCQIRRYFKMIIIVIMRCLYKCTLIIWNLLNTSGYLVQWCIQRLIDNRQRERNNIIKVIHHSENYLIVDKPYDMFINSNNPDRTNTLQLKLRRMLPDLVNPKLRHEFHFVHRLDYPTSGIICIALNKNAARAASAAFENQRVKKFYLALVHGHVNNAYVIIDKAIGNDIREKHGSHKMCTSDSIFCVKPRSSYTTLVVLEYGSWNDKPATKVLLVPGTGRRHQLRVHCHHIGHTIIGDYTYSEGKDTEPHRTFLHAFRLILKNDIEDIDIRTADPFDAIVLSTNWKTTSVINILDEYVSSDIYKS